MQKITRKNVPYTRCFCEENVYRLLELLQHGNAIFISNKDKTVHFKNLDITWDYHVVAAVNGKIYDHDAQDLQFPCSIDEWIIASFAGVTDKKLLPKFRVVSWEILKDTFNSDRSHMLQHKAEMDKLGMCFPPEPVIGMGTNLFSDFVNMENSDIGTIFTLEEFENL